MVDTTGNTDVAVSPDVVINPNTNNPQSVTQTSTLGLTDNNGLGEDGFELSIDLTGSDVAQTVNIKERFWHRLRWRRQQ